MEEEEDLNSISTHRVAHTITESHMKRDNCHFHNPKNVLLVINEEKKDSSHTSTFFRSKTEEMLYQDRRFDRGRPGFSLKPADVDLFRK